jgi:hypothetical protein
MQLDRLWNPSDPIETVWQKAQECRRFASSGFDPISEALLSAKQSPCSKNLESLPTPSAIGAKDRIPNGLGPISKPTLREQMANASAFSPLIASVTMALIMPPKPPPLLPLRPPLTLTQPQPPLSPPSPPPTVPQHPSPLLLVFITAGATPSEKTLCSHQCHLRNTCCRTLP